MFTVTEAFSHVGRVRLTQITRAAVRYAAENPDAPNEAGRPVWAALAALGCPASQTTVEADHTITDALLANDAPESVELHFFPGCGDLWMLRPHAAKAEHVIDLWGPVFDD